MTFSTLFWHTHTLSGNRTLSLEAISAVSLGKLPRLTRSNMARQATYFQTTLKRSLVACSHSSTMATIEDPRQTSVWTWWEVDSGVCMTCSSTPLPMCTASRWTSWKPFMTKLTGLWRNARMRKWSCIKVTFRIAIRLCWPTLCAMRSPTSRFLFLTRLVPRLLTVSNGGRMWMKRRLLLFLRFQTCTREISHKILRVFTIL